MLVARLGVECDKVHDYVVHGPGQVYLQCTRLTAQPDPICWKRQLVADWCPAKGRSGSLTGCRQTLEPGAWYAGAANGEM